MKKYYEKRMYNSILARSFGRNEQKRLGYGATICCLIVVFIFCTSFKPYHLGPLPNALNLKVTMGIGVKMLALKSDEIMNRPASSNKAVVFCNTAERRTEFCEINTHSRVDTKSFSVLVSNESSFMSTIIRPYARKDDGLAMRKVRKWSIRSVKQEKGLGEAILCTQNHVVPALLFSLGGYAGNHFHDFSDLVIPLFITSRKYKKEVQFLITDYKPSSAEKLEKILKGLSNYEPINIDKEGDEVHCFPSLKLGLQRHERELAIDPEKHSTSMKEFRDFLISSFSIRKETDDYLLDKKPRLLILSRTRSRAFMNTEEIAVMARVLGFDVVVSEADSDLSRFSKVVASCDVLMGVHGAGLTNMVFLPDNAVFIQILPIGGFEWLGKTDFDLPSRGMNLSYLEYKISVQESTLINEFPIDHEVLRGTFTVQKYGWHAFKSIFLEKQNVNLNVTRFKPTLVKALELLRR